MPRASAAAPSTRSGASGCWPRFDSLGIEPILVSSTVREHVLRAFVAWADERSFRRGTADESACEAAALPARGRRRSASSPASSSWRGDDGARELTEEELALQRARVRTTGTLEPRAHLFGRGGRRPRSWPSSIPRRDPPGQRARRAGLQPLRDRARDAHRVAVRRPRRGSASSTCSSACARAAPPSRDKRQFEFNLTQRLLHARRRRPRARRPCSGRRSRSSRGWARSTSTSRAGGPANSDLPEATFRALAARDRRRALRRRGAARRGRRRPRRRRAAAPRPPRRRRSRRCGAGPRSTVRSSSWTRTRERDDARGPQGARAARARAGELVGHEALAGRARRLAWSPRTRSNGDVTSFTSEVRAGHRSRRSQLMVAFLDGIAERRPRIPVAGIAGLARPARRTWLGRLAARRGDPAPRSPSASCSRPSCARARTATSPAAAAAWSSSTSPRASTRTGTAASRASSARSSETNQPLGLVVFSDSALRGAAARHARRGAAADPALLRAARAGGAAGRAAARTGPRLPREPLVGRLPRRHAHLDRPERGARDGRARPGRDPTVVLVSDLDDSPFDLKPLTRGGHPLRAGRDRPAHRAALPRARRPRALQPLAGEDAFVYNDELLRNTELEERRSLVGGFPIGLVAVGALVLLLRRAERARARAPELAAPRGAGVRRSVALAPGARRRGGGRVPRRARARRPALARRHGAGRPALRGGRRRARTCGAPTRSCPRGSRATLLDVDDDIAYREVLQQFGLARVRQPVRDQRDLALRGRGRRRSWRGSGSSRWGAQRLSMLANLSGALAFEEARFDEGQRATFLRRSLAEFREAIKLDPANEDAKYNLELVLRLIVNAQQRVERRRRRGARRHAGERRGRRHQRQRLLSSCRWSVNSSRPPPRSSGSSPWSAIGVVLVAERRSPSRLPARSGSCRAARAAARRRPRRRARLAAS